MKGLPFTGSSAFSTLELSCRMRVPRPPARMTHCCPMITVSKKPSGSILHEHLRALVIEAEAYFGQALIGHGCAQAGAILRVEEQETTATGADQLPSERAIGACDVIPAID